MKFKLIPAVALILSATTASADPMVEIDFSYGFEAGDYPCVITQAPVLDIGEISEEGIYATQTEMVITCEDSNSKFMTYADTSPTTTGRDIYKDDFIQVWAGTVNHMESGVLTRRTYDYSLTGCSEGGAAVAYTNLETIGEYQIYPMGGTQMWENSNNGSVCMLLERPEASGIYSITIQGIVEVSEVPSAAEIDSVPTQFVLPINLIQMFEVNDV